MITGMIEDNEKIVLDGMNTFSMIIRTGFTEGDQNVFVPQRRLMLEKKQVSLMIRDNFNEGNATCVEKDVDRSHQKMMLNLYNNNLPKSTKVQSAFKKEWNSEKHGYPVFDTGMKPKNLATNLENVTSKLSNND